MKQHVYTHSHHDSIQSAYLELHSTETALMKFQNDSLCNLDNGNCAIFIMLDLSLAFDTVDHRIQCVIIYGVNSPEMELVCGVPQGSALGPPLFSSYIGPVGDVVHRYGLTQHADDKDIYIAFKPRPEDVCRTEQMIENCWTELHTWFAQTFL